MFRAKAALALATALLLATTESEAVVVPARLELVSRFSGTSPRGMVVVANECFVGKGRSVQPIDISSATDPQVVKSEFDVFDIANGLDWSNGRIYVASSDSEDPSRGWAWVFDAVSGGRLEVHSAPVPLWSVKVREGRIFSVGTRPSGGPTGGYLFVFREGYRRFASLSLPALSMSTGSRRGRLQIDGDYVYISITNHGLYVADVSNPDLPVLISTVPIAGGATDLVLQGGLLHVATPQGVRIFDISDPGDPTEVIHFAEDLSVQAITANGTTVLAAHEFGLAQYQVVGATQVVIGPAYEHPNLWEVREIESSGGAAFVLEHSLGFLAFDVTSDDVIRPPVGEVFLGHPVSQVSMQRDRLAANVFRGGTQIVNILDLESPSHLGWAHRLDTLGGVLYNGNVLYAATLSLDLRVYDVSDPSRPQQMGEVGLLDPIVLCMTLRDSILYIGEFNGLGIYNVADPLNPSFIRQLGIGPVSSVVSSGTYEYVATEKNLLVYDGSDRGNPQQINVVPLGETMSTISAVISGDFLFVDGTSLQIFDISDRGNPVWRSNFFRPGSSYQFGGIAVRGNVLVMGGKNQNVLYIDVSDPAEPRVVGDFPVGSSLVIRLRGPYVIKTADSIEVWKEIYEPAPGENLPPVAAVAANDLMGSIGETTTFDGSPSFDPEGNPVSYSWRPLPGTPNYEAITGHNETFFSTVPLEPGTYRFDLVVNDGELNSDPLEVRYYVPGIQGYVTYEGTNYPIEGAEICASGFDNPGNETSFCTFTDVDGYYALAAPIGGATISATADGLESYEARVNVPSAGLLWNISLAGGTVPLAGKAVAAGDGTPLEGVTVLLDPGRVPSTLTDQNGEFTFSHVLEGERLISLAQDGFGADTLNIEVSGGDGATVEFSLSQGEPASIVGSVTDMSTGLAVGAASVSLGGVRSAMTRADGSFALDEIVSGTYAILLTLPDGTLDVRTTNITPGENHIPLSIGARRFSIAVNVLDSVGQPLSGADLVVTIPTQNESKPLGIYLLSGKTDSTGYARLSSLPPGIQRISVFSETTEPFEEELTVLLDGEVQTLVSRFAWGDLTRDSSVNWKDLFILGQRWSGSFDPYPDPAMPSAEKPELGAADLFRLLRALRGDE